VASSSMVGNTRITKNSNNSIIGTSSNFGSLTIYRNKNGLTTGTSTTTNGRTSFRTNLGQFTGSLNMGLDGNGVFRNSYGQNSLHFEQ